MTAHVYTGWQSRRDKERLSIYGIAYRTKKEYATGRVAQKAPDLFFMYSYSSTVSMRDEMADIQDEGLLAQAAALAGATVAIVKYSGNRGTHKEFSALVKGLEDAAAQHPNNPYIKALLTPASRRQIDGFSQQFDDVPKQSTVNDFKMSALNRCAQASAWLLAHAPADAAAEVKTAIIAVCHRVAAESKETGTFTCGADSKDPFEESVIGEIDRALHES